jgi:uncharacterized protein (TIGR03435 family)
MRMIARYFWLPVALAASSIWAQPSLGPRFEVAVIKPAPDCALASNGGGGGKLGQMSPGRIEVECATLWNLIGGAYAVDEHLQRRRVQIEGGPRWLKSETYRITAKTEDGRASVPMMMGPMMRALMEERLALRAHTEMREGPVYELVGAKGGLKAKASTPGACVPGDPNRPPQDLHPNSDTYKNCGMRSLRTRSGMVLEATGVTMSELAQSLPLDRETVNRTGIEGRFDFVLRYSNEDASTPAAESTTERSPGIFTALVEQLGLRVIPARGPLQFVIIDSVQRPTEN